MTGDEILDLVMARSKANGLQVLVTFDNRPDFRYHAKDAAARDGFVARMTAKIGAPDPLNHVIRSVTVCA